MAANARQGRHVMTQTPCDRYDLLVLVRWFGSGGSLSRPDDVDQCADRPLMRRESLSKYPAPFPDLPSGRHAGGIALASRPQSTSELTSNPHSARCQPVPNFPVPCETVANLSRGGFRQLPP
jgi:hypothetical protein